PDPTQAGFTAARWPALAEPGGRLGVDLHPRRRTEPQRRARPRDEHGARGTGEQEREGAGQAAHGGVYSGEGSGPVRREAGLGAGRWDVDAAAVVAAAGAAACAVTEVAAELAEAERQTRERRGVEGGVGEEAGPHGASGKYLLTQGDESHSTYRVWAAWS